MPEGQLSVEPGRCYQRLQRAHPAIARPSVEMGCTATVPGMAARPDLTGARSEDPDGSEQPLRMAVFGWVQENAGSVSSANFQLCRALLDQGHRIDLFVIEGFVPDPGYEHQEFVYAPVALGKSREALVRRLPAAVRPLAEKLAGRLRSNQYRVRAIDAARTSHACDPYDAALFLGLPPTATLRGVPNVVWAQGPPRNELIAVRRLREPVSRISGVKAYVRLRVYYEIKDRLTWRWARSPHYLVLASRASRQVAADFGIEPRRVCVAPYPVDLQRFTPGPIPTGDVRRVLCVGRLDPRKRVDLLVDAVRLLAARRTDFWVEVIGRDAYLPGWGAWVRQHAEGLPLSYRDAIPQAEVLERMRQADVLVQPSEQEEFGSAVAEALACGVPVVTGPTNGTGEYAPAEASVHFDRYDPGTLAAALERALSFSRDPSARAACRQAAQAFDARRVAVAVADHTRAAIAEHQAAAPSCRGT